MLKSERRARFQVACEVANRVYTDLCRDPEVPKAVTDECCYLLIEMQKFAASLDPRPYDHEEEPTNDEQS